MREGEGRNGDQEPERWEAEMMQHAMKDGTRVSRENRPQLQMHLADLLKGRSARMPSYLLPHPPFSFQNALTI